MTSKPMFRRRVFGRCPIGADLQDQEAFDVLRANLHVEARSLLADFPRHKVGTDQHAYPLGINPQRRGLLIYFGLDVLHDLLCQSKVVLRGRNQYQVASGAFGGGIRIAKWIGGSHFVWNGLVTGISELTPSGSAPASIAVRHLVRQEVAELSIEQRKDSRGRREASGICSRHLGFRLMHKVVDLGRVQAERILNWQAHIAPISMNSACASIAQTPLLVNPQSSVDAVDVFVAGVIKGTVRQIAGFIAQAHIYINLLVHIGIFSRLQSKFHSWFPVVVFVHTQTVTGAGA